MCCIYVRICICAWVWVRACACACACTCVGVCVCVCVCMSIGICTCKCICMCVCICICTCISLPTSTHQHVHMDIFISKHARNKQLQTIVTCLGLSKADTCMHLTSIQRALGTRERDVRRKLRPLLELKKYPCPKAVCVQVPSNHRLSNMLTHITDYDAKHAKTKYGTSL